MANIIVVNKSSDWATVAAEHVIKSVIQVNLAEDICNFMLTGGVTAELLYSRLGKSDSLRKCKINLLFGDERCVDPISPESNFGMVQRTLLMHGLQIARNSKQR